MHAEARGGQRAADLVAGPRDAAGAAIEAHRQRGGQRRGAGGDDPPERGGAHAATAAAGASTSL